VSTPESQAFDSGGHPQGPSPGNGALRPGIVTPGDIATILRRLVPFPLAALSLVACPLLARSDVPEVDARAARVHESALVVDGHNDVPTFVLDYGFDLGMDGSDPAKRDATWYWIPGSGWLLPDPAGDDLRTDTDLARLRTGGVDAQFFSIFAHSRYEGEAARRRASDMLDAMHTQIQRHPEHLELATTADDVARIARAGRIAVLLGLEGGHAIAGDLEHLRDFHARGIRYMTLTWSNSNDWADASTDEVRHGGLTDFGREVVREMNRLGMLVDLSHVSDATFYDALEVTRAPVILSHSSCRALVEHPRNASDAMLRALAANGGVIMINFSESYLDPAKAGIWPSLRFFLTHLGWEDTPFEAAIDHIEHAVAVAGVDHVGLGSDFDGTLFLPEGLKEVSDLPHLTAALLDRGYSAQDVHKILGGNVLRALAEAEARSASEP